MKNYKGLYTSTKSTQPTKNVMQRNFRDNPFQKNISARNFKPSRFNNKLTENKVDRIVSRSIEDFSSSGIRYRNTQVTQMNNNLQNQEAEDEQPYFRASYKKINKMKNIFSNHEQIENELNEILNLIKQQRNCIDKQINEMKLQQNKKPECNQLGMNTQQIIPEAQQKHLKDEQTQTFQQKKQLNMELCSKLTQMLKDMGINCQDILPNEMEIQDLNIQDYKILAQGEIIKIQKFFIKKLVEKIPKE